jgi:hypothetical protein
VTLSWAQLQAAGITGVGNFNNVTVKALYPTDTLGVPNGYLVSAPTALTVNDTAPTATFSGTALAGGTGSVSFANVFDPSSSDTAAGFLYSYDVGNTGTFQVSNSTSPTFTLPASDLYQAGSIVVRGRITDEFGTYTDYIITVPIADQPPTIPTIDGNKSVNENTLVSLTNVSFSDPTEANLTATVNWGDGTTTVGFVATTNTTPIPTTGSVSGSHAYTQPGTYSVSVTLQDSEGQTATNSFQVKVSDLPLTVSAGSAQTVDVGSLVSLTNATFSDPSAPLPQGSYSATVNWGDGTSTDTNPTIDAPVSPSSLGQIFDSHYYGQAGTYTVTVSLTKPNQAPVSNTFQVTVDEVVPTVNAGPNVLGGLGVPVNIDASFSSPGYPVASVQQTYTATINWGDDTTSTGVVTFTPGSPGVLTTGTVTGSHNYKGDGPYKVTVNVNDGTGIGSGTLQVIE